MHPAGLIAFRHLLMDDPAAGRHPLNVAGGNGAAIPHAIAVFHRTGEHVGDRLDATMRMPRKAGQVILGNVIAKIVEKEERVEIGRVPETESPAQMHARAFKRGLRLDKAFHWSNRHSKPLPRDLTVVAQESY